jgi:tyrosine-specific transport protein
MAAAPVSLSRIIGALLLIVGTSVGGGMLALPLATASLGFWPACVYLLLTWLVMTAGALLIMEVNSWLPVNSHLISMAAHTIGRTGQVLTWLMYLLLLYSLLAAYIAGGQDVLINLSQNLGWHLPAPFAALMFLVIFSSIVYSGIRQVDWVNRIIMLIKLGTYLGLVFALFPLAKLPNFPLHQNLLLAGAPVLMVMITAYGFAIIVPSLRYHLNDNLRILRRVLWIGSFIPLVLYILWEALIFSVLPATGPDSLASISQSSTPIAALMQSLNHVSAHSSLGWFANIFTSVCVVTAFLGVSLALFDFLADGLSMHKNGRSGLSLYLLTFIPPLILVFIGKRVFLYALSLGGVFCVFLLMLLPSLMAWSGRYRKGYPNQYRLFGGKLSLILLMLVSLGLVLMNIVR